MWQITEQLAIVGKLKLSICPKILQNFVVYDMCIMMTAAELFDTKENQKR